MKIKRVVLVVAAFTVLVLSSTLESIPALTVTTDDKTIKALYYVDDIDFSIRWRHSVEMEDWEEMFIVENDTIQLEATRFKTFGAGVPSDAGEDTYIKDGWVYMTGINQTIGKELIIRTGIDTEHRFMDKEETVPLMESEKAYRIKIERHTILQAVLNYIKNKMR
jgi:hypothetical protein